MISAGIEAYDAKTSLPRHIENQKEMREQREILSDVRDVLTQIKGGFTAFKWIGGFVSFAWAITQIAESALKVVETLHKAGN